MMMRGAALVAAAAACSTPAAAQFAPPLATVSIPMLHKSLDVFSGASTPCPQHGPDPNKNGVSPDGQSSSQPQECVTVRELVSFIAGSFRFTSPPPLKYDLVPGYAYYVSTCTPPRGLAQTQTGPIVLPSKSMSLTPATAMRFLPPPPALAADTSLTMVLPQTTDLSFMAQPPGLPQPDAPSAAWGQAAAQGGRYAIRSTQPLLKDAPLPAPGAGAILVTAAPFYPLKDAPYLTIVGPGGVLLSNGQQGMALAINPKAPFVEVQGELSGGKWAQGAGLLSIPAPGAMAVTQCANGFFVTPVDGATLARFIGSGKAFAAPQGSTFTRTAQ